MSSHFDTIAGEYDAALPAHVVEHYLRKRTAYVVAHCPPGRGLDVGCGTGVLAARLARAGWTMTGADPSGGMLDVLRARSPEVTAVVAVQSARRSAKDTRIPSSEHPVLIGLNPAEVDRRSSLRPIPGPPTLEMPGRDALASSRPLLRLEDRRPQRGVRRVVPFRFQVTPDTGREFSANGSRPWGS